MSCQHAGPCNGLPTTQLGPCRYRDDAASNRNGNGLHVPQDKVKLLSWMPPKLAAWIYTVLLKPAPIRALAQRVICRFIPEEMPVRGVSLVLNQDDAIVSGNLALGCYETYNLDIFESLLRPGMCVVDVGANIGLYSAVAAAGRAD